MKTTVAKQPISDTGYRHAGGASATLAGMTVAGRPDQSAKGRNAIALGHQPLLARSTPLRYDSPTMTNPHTVDITLTVNGTARTLSVLHHWSLLDVLRDSLGLSGAKRGCDRGECGSCTVLVDGMTVNACQVLAIRASGRDVLTVEGLAPAGELSPLQQAFLDEDGGQCGFCTPGFVMSARALLDANPDPSDADIREALSGNLCRCNAYGRILASVRTAAQRRA